MALIRAVLVICTLMAAVSTAVAAELKVTFRGPGGTWQTTLTAGQLAVVSKHRKDIEDRHNLDACREVVFPLGKAPRRLWFHAVTYVKGMRSFTEWRLGNDSIDDPIGFQAGHLYVVLNDYVVISTRDLSDRGEWIELYDQTSVTGVIGTPFWAPDLAKLEPYLESWKPEGGMSLNLDREKILYTIRNRWSRPDPRGEDTYPGWEQTHTTGSLGATLDDPFALSYFAFPNEHGPAKTSLRWVHEQMGTIFPDDKGVRRYVPGRPHHLYRYAPGVCRPYSRILDRTAEPVIFAEGAVALKSGRSMPEGVGVETLGRIDLPWVDVRDPDIGWNVLNWTGGRIQGAGAWSPSQITARKKNGGDAEHMYRQIRTAICAMLTPSLFARHTLQTLAEGWTSPGPDRWGVGVKGWNHSDRTLGWMINLFIWAGHVLDDQRYFEMARSMRDAALSRHTNGLIPDWVPSDAPYVLSRERQRSFSGDLSTSACWMNAITSNACQLGMDLDIEGEREKWRRLAEQAIRVADACVVYDSDGRAIGLAENSKLHKDGRLTQDPGPSPGVAWTSTRSWVSGPAAGMQRRWTRDAYRWYRKQTRWPRYQDDNDTTWKWHRRLRVFAGAGAEQRDVSDVFGEVESKLEALEADARASIQIPSEQELKERWTNADMELVLMMMGQDRRLFSLTLQLERVLDRQLDAVKIGEFLKENPGALSGIHQFVSTAYSKGQ